MLCWLYLPFFLVLISNAARQQLKLRNRMINARNVSSRRKKKKGLESSTFLYHLPLLQLNKTFLFHWKKKLIALVI